VAPSLWVQRGVTAALAGLALGGGVFWVAQILSLGSVDASVRFVAEPPQTSQSVPLGRILGARETAAQANVPKSTLSLVAVIASGTQSGSAMISINGQKALAYAPGEEVQAGRHVVELGLRRVGLGPDPKGPVTEVLELKVPRLPTE
jgi:hypothetical protein